MTPKRDDYTVAWITDAGEAKALLERNDSLHKEPRDFSRSPNDSNAYNWGKFGDHNVVIVRPTNKTLSAQATVEALLASVPNVRFGLFVGCAAGSPDPAKCRDIRLGDVVVNRSDNDHGGLVQYDMESVGGQQAIGEDNFLVKPPQVLLNALENFCQTWKQQAEEIIEEIWHSPPQDEENRDRLFNPSYPHVAGPNCDQCDSNELVKRSPRERNGPVLHIGLIASGNHVVRDIESRSKIDNYLEGPCLCFDTEAAGLMNNFPCISIQGISRYADSHKNNHKWYYYASAVAAIFAMRYLKSLPAEKVSGLPRLADSLKSKPSCSYHPSVRLICSLHLFHSSIPYPVNQRSSIALGSETLSQVSDHSRPRTVGLTAKP
jgi:nucleoside phosphorylase